MSVQGIILIDIIAVSMIVLILNLVRMRFLTAGYALFWILPLVGGILTLSIPTALEKVTVLVGAIYPASAMSLLAFIFVFLLLIFFSVQVSVLSNRQVELTQTIALLDLALREAKEENE
jgi:hypothetical protein